MDTGAGIELTPRSTGPTTGITVDASGSGRPGAAGRTEMESVLGAVPPIEPGGSVVMRFRVEGAQEVRDSSIQFKFFFYISIRGLV